LAEAATAETATLKVGDEAPDFELPATPMGEKFKLSDHRGKNAVIINFVPAAFSPVCSNQAGVIEQKRAEFVSQGALPVIVSSDGAWTQAAWKEKLGVDFPILSDFNPQGDTARKYGVLIEGYGIANRVVVVVGKDGRVAWIQPSEKIVSLPDYDPVLSCSKG
jgi:peroxiredoxin